MFRFFIFLSLFSSFFLSSHWGGQALATEGRFAFAAIIGSAQGGGSFCAESRAKAIQNCYATIEKFSEKNHVLGDIFCGRCKCDPSNVSATPSTCLAAVRWDDEKDNSDLKQRTKLLTGYESAGFGCGDAVRQAAHRLYNKMGEFADSNRVIGYELNQCSCGGHPFASATCSAIVTYLEKPSSSR